MSGFALVLVAAVLMGGAATAVGPRNASREFRAVCALLAGLVGLHLWLSLSSWLGLPWSVVSVGAPCAAAAVFGAVRNRRSWFTAKWHPFGWGDALAAGAVAFFAYFSLRLWIVFSDFFHHWGAKGQRFFLARGVDLSYLEAPWNQSAVPWYPTALPELFAASALAAGEFTERAAMAWSVVGVVALVVAAREALHRAPVSASMRQALLSGIAALAAAYGIALRLAGSPDLMIALGLTVAAVALLEDPRDDNTALIGLAAAFLAGLKVEGIALAGILLICDQLRRVGTRVFSWPRAALQAVPAVSVVALWYLLNARLGPPRVQGWVPLDGERLAAVLDAVAAELNGGRLFGFPWLLFTIPLALTTRVSRWVGVVVALYCGFLFWVYATSPEDPEIYVRTTLHRLLVQVIPALVTALAVALAGIRDPEPERNR